VIHLDSSFLIDLQRETLAERPGDAVHLIESFDEHEVLGVSVHVVCELRAGAELAKHSLRAHAALDELVHGLLVVYPNEKFPGAYAALLAAIKRTGKSVSAMDLLIGTAATLDGAPLVTKNVKDFARIPGLRLLTY
jgi:tRNA(fMet)-specific endonuclease VapC